MELGVPDNKRRWLRDLTSLETLIWLREVAIPLSFVAISGLFCWEAMSSGNHQRNFSDGINFGITGKLIELVL